MGKRHNKIGIKQTIQKHWLDHTVKMMLAGLSESEIRSELYSYLAAQKTNRSRNGDTPQTHRFVVDILSAWFSPNKELTSFRDHALDLTSKAPPESWIPFHWAVICASYPFWFNVAKQTGRILNLQDQVTQAQVFVRLKEQYGDRETVTRNARHVIRAFVAWGVLIDSGIKGCYENNSSLNACDSDSAILLFEAALHAAPEGKGALGVIKSNPAFFPFQFPIMTGDFISRHSSLIEVVRYGLDDELLKLK